MPQGQISGAERVLLELLEEVPSGRVVVFAPASSPLAAEVRRLGFPVKNFYVPKFKDAASPLQYVRQLARSTRALNRGIKADDITLLHAFLPLTLKVVVPVARWTRVPVIVSVHDITSRDAIGGVKSTMQRLLVTSAARRIVAVSEYVAQTLRESGYPAERIRVIHNGLDPDRVLGPRDRVHFSLPEEALVFAVIARVTPWKGQDVALEAFVRTRADLPDEDLRLLFAGGPFEAGDELFAERLRARTGQLGLTDVVHFLGHQDDPWPVYRVADVVLVPSTRPDPFPTVVLEAGLAERPVVVTALGGGREAILDGTTGIVAPPTPRDFADAMIEAANQGWRTHAGSAAAGHVRATFARHSYVSRILAVWRECLPC